MPLQNHGLMLPVEQIIAHRQRGLVALAVKAGIKHVKTVMMPEYKRNVNRHAVKSALHTGTVKDRFGITVWRHIFLYPCIA